VANNVNILKTGLIYRNPKPHVHSVHAYFPSVVMMDNGEMLATFVLGEAFESADLAAHVARSSDGGETWHHEGPIYPGTKTRVTSDTVRITSLPGGKVVAFMARHDRTRHLNEGLSNPKTLGFVPTELLLLRSRDYGRTWSRPALLIPPLAGPSFEMCSPIVRLKDGRWLLPTSTWSGWNGECPEGMKMVCLISRDRGKAWPTHADVMRDPRQHVIYWESKIIEMPDGTLVAIAWAYDGHLKKDLPNQYAVSRDGGRTWTPPQSTGLVGQTLTPHLLPDGRILCVYRRIDKPGLWAAIVRYEQNHWAVTSHTPLWGTTVSGLTAHGANMSDNFSVLRFGAPTIAALPDGLVFTAFWCYEECVSVIRWFTLQV